MANVRSYCLNVRVGNWNEDMYLAEVSETKKSAVSMLRWILWIKGGLQVVNVGVHDFQAELKDFVERKERGQLAAQKSSFLNDSLLQQVKRFIVLIDLPLLHPVHLLKHTECPQRDRHTGGCGGLLTI